MSSDNDPLLEVATDVVEHRAVDWDARLKASPQHRRVLGNLRRIHQLAEAFDRAEDIVDGGTESQEKTTEPPAAPPIFTWGHLRITERIGEGSFGEVYRAFNPILQRDVALKLKREGASGTPVASAYIDEARRLARIRHPNVLAIHGADVHDGRVGLWADLLSGRTLEQEIEAGAPFSTSRAVELTLALAKALSAVHRAGLVHGDVKASNVMLEEDGGVVLMDFGAGSDLDKGPGHHSPAGSPLSMAPELFTGASATQASDLYSLGVLLFRMLAGRYPATAESFEELAAHHLRGERAPIRSVLSAFPRSLRRFTRRLLAPDAARRPSAAEAVERLRWIQQAPARRRRRLVIAAVVVSLLLGTVTATVGYVQARRSEARAVAARQEAEAITDFLRDVLASPRPSEGGRQATVAEVLERAVDKIDVQLVDQPLVRARTLAIMGRTYLSFHRHSAAEPLLRRSLALREPLEGADDPEVLETRVLLAEALINFGRLEEAETLLDGVLARAEPLGSDHQLQVLARIMRARIARDRQDFPAARQWLEEALERRSGETWVDDPARRSAELDLAKVLLIEGSYTAAEALLRQLVEWNERVNGERHGSTLMARHSLAVALDRQGRSAEAEPLMRHNLSVAESWLGEEDPHTITAISDLSNNLADQGKVTQSAELSERVLELTERTLGPTDENTLATMGNHAARLLELGRVDEAAALMRETIERADEALGPAHEMALINRYNLAELLYFEGRFEGALTLAREAREAMAATLGERHFFTLVTDALIGASLTGVGHSDEGEQVLRRTLELLRETMGEGHPNTLDTQIYLARALRARGRLEEAESLLTDAFVRRQAVLGAEHPKTLEAKTELQGWQQADGHP